MFEDSYLCEANIMAAKIMIDEEWKKAEQIKIYGGKAIYLAIACMYPSSILEYWSILFYTHGGC